ncbi:uncharacterized protein PSFLO_04206 [Pseudozyma flocculosa]|uniref:Uncharacterized protein n=1 Tax=Pseudozyma flocculosa TaxID=84751 RepID=A0A5C3F4W2_9BASI|nr:uncharacterized protein PSFLO_04206 [Pseudozyma flocculosa]
MGTIRTAYASQPAAERLMDMGRYGSYRQHDAHRPRPLPLPLVCVVGQPPLARGALSSSASSRLARRKQTERRRAYVRAGADGPSSKLIVPLQKNVWRVEATLKIFRPLAACVPASRAHQADEGRTSARKQPGKAKKAVPCLGGRAMSIPLNPSLGDSKQACLLMPVTPLPGVVVVVLLPRPFLDRRSGVAQFLTCRARYYESGSRSGAAWGNVSVVWRAESAKPTGGLRDASDLARELPSSRVHYFELRTFRGRWQLAWLCAGLNETVLPGVGAFPGHQGWPMCRRQYLAPFQPPALITRCKRGAACGVLSRAQHKRNEVSAKGCGHDGLASSAGWLECRGGGWMPTASEVGRRCPLCLATTSLEGPSSSLSLPSYKPAWHTSCRYVLCMYDESRARLSACGGPLPSCAVEYRGEASAASTVDAASDATASALATGNRGG